MDSQTSNNSKTVSVSPLSHDYDVIVIGGGHAGIESALACVRLNKKTLLICGRKENIGQMPCNPSIGGPAKGVVVREIDALGGEMAKAADKTALQIKMLNLSRGPAVWALRVQSDKVAYAKYMQDKVIHQAHLKVLEEFVSRLVIKDNVCSGIILTDNTLINSKKIILTTGTYLASLVLKGPKLKSQKHSTISEQLKNLGLKLIRLKTGTPPRVLRSSINFTNALEQPGIDLESGFSYFKPTIFKTKNQEMCWLIHTNQKIKQIVETNLESSPMYSGKHIVGQGPRYCPSFEDKVVRFNHKERHQIFLEPESLSLDTIYLQGFSTSMPEFIQDQMVHNLPGLENAKILRYGFAVEYDAVEPTQMKHSLENKLIKNLYTAGQINGTSGYEEAACQGLMAGINACLAIDKKPPLILNRDEAYIGVLIDDLVTRGTNEPYRLLTSRAEWRLMLRNDNAELRLKKYGYEVGLISDQEFKQFTVDKALMESTVAKLGKFKISNPNLIQLINDALQAKKTNKILDNTYASKVIKRNELSHGFLKKHLSLLKCLPNHIQEMVIIALRYEGYIKNEKREIAKTKKFESLVIPFDLDYKDVANLSSEAKEKLQKIKPINIGQAGRIPGINYVDIQMLLFHLKQHKSHFYFFLKKV